MISIHMDGLDNPILWYKGQYDTFGYNDMLKVLYIMVDDGIELEEILSSFEDIPRCLYDAEEYPAVWIGETARFIVANYVVRNEYISKGKFEKVKE
jgi:hypothetical protein